MIVLYLAEDLGVMEKLPVEVSSKVCCMDLGEVTMSISSAHVISVQKTSSCQVLCAKKMENTTQNDYVVNTFCTHK